MLLLHQAVAIVAAASQVTITATQWSQASSHTGRALTALLAAGLVILAFGVVRYPHYYWRHRNWMMPAGRIAVLCFPTVRQTGVGAALMLEQPAQPGWLGACKDFCRLVAGTRLLGIVVGGVTLIMSPAATLTTQALLVLLTRNTPGYCATQLLRAPLSQRRAALLATLLELAALPVLMVAPLAGRLPLGSTLAEELPSGQAAPEHVCHALVPFVSTTLGVVLPTALAAYCWPAPAAHAELQDGSDVVGSGSGRGSNRRGGGDAATLPPPGQPSSGARGVRGSLRGAAATVEAAANRMLHALFCGTSGFGSRSLVCWWLTVLSWWLCSRLGGGLR